MGRKMPSLGEIFCSIIPIILLETAFALVTEILIFVLSLGGGLVIGKVIVHHIYRMFRHPGVIQGPSRMFNEVMYGAIMMFLIVLLIMVPLEKHILKPMRNQLFKKTKIGIDFILALFNAFCLGLCFAEISILFEIRYCKLDFNFFSLNGPVRAFIYIIEDLPGNFGLGTPVDEGFEEVIAFPLFVAFAYPIYSLIRCYMSAKNSSFSLYIFLEKIIPKPCCFDRFAGNVNPNDGKSEIKKYIVQWKDQIFGLILELGELLSLNFAVLFLLYTACNLTANARPGFVFIGFGMFGFSYSLALVLVENLFPYNLKTAKNGIESRILLNIALLVFFVSKNFLVYFENPKEELCSTGQLEMRSEISVEFAHLFTICVYAGWKIIFLSVAFYDSERTSFQAIVRFISDFPEKTRSGWGVPCGADDATPMVPTLQFQNKFLRPNNPEIMIELVKTFGPSVNMSNLNKKMKGESEFVFQAKDTQETQDVKGEIPQ